MLAVPVASNARVRAIKVFEYVGDYVVKAYSTVTCEELECRIADYEIYKWLVGLFRGGGGV